jgi:CheY-like chemotaxis protein
MAWRSTAGTTVAIALPTRYTTDSLSLAYDADFLAPVEAPQVIEPAAQENLLGDLSGSSTVDTAQAQLSETAARFPTPAPSEPQSQSQPGADIEEARVAPLVRATATVEAALAAQRGVETAGTAGTAEAAEAAETLAQPGATVLVVEDQMPVRRLFKKALERRDVTVEEATNGVEGLAKLKEREYDCVFSGQSFARCTALVGLRNAALLMSLNPRRKTLADMWMPEMNGDEMTVAFRVWEAANRQRRQLIIAVSAVDTAEVSVL